MKVVFLIHSLSVGGAETVAVEYLIKLQERGCDVLLIEFFRSESFLYDRLEKANIKIITLCDNGRGFFAKVLRRLGQRFVICKKLNSILREESPDILHIHTGLDCVADIKFDITKIFYSFHTSVARNLEVIGSRHKRAMLKYANKGMRFFVLSEAMKQDAIKVLPTDKIYVLPNGLDLDGIKNRTYERARLLSELGIPEDAFVLCHTARMHPVKNHLKTVSVFSEVVKKKPDSYLLLIGRTDCDILSRINALTEKYGLTDKVKILGNRADATAVMSVCNAMILPSVTEGFSLVALEAQALGLRCVLTDAVPDEVVCNDNCFKLSIDKSDEIWAEYILGDFTQKHLSKIEDLNIDVIIGTLIDHYDRALKSV